MGARAMWKGRLKLGALEVPVKLYAAVKDQTVHFRLLDSKRKEPVKQHMVNSETGAIVEPSAIRRAVEIDGDLVIVGEEELAGLEPAESREIEMEQFLKAGSISHEWYDRPYYLGPDGSDGSYFALAEALRKKDREGVARWVMRKKQYVGALRSEGGYLTLTTLRRAGEVVQAGALRPPVGRELAAKEVAMARQLLEAMEEGFDLASFRDEYRERVMELIEAKKAGKVIKFPKATPRETDDDIATALQRSLIAVRKERASA